MASKKQAETVNFEKSLETLEKTVEKMESGDLTLEQSLTQFEKGIALIKGCQKALMDAEQKVMILTKNNTLETFETDD